MTQQGTIGLALLLQILPLAMADGSDSSGGLSSFPLIAGALVLGYVILKKQREVQDIETSKQKLVLEINELKKQSEELKKELELRQSQSYDPNRPADSIIKQSSGNEELIRIQKEKENIERTLESLKKQEREWELQKQQLIKENQQFKESLSKLEAKNQALTQENTQLRNQITEKAQSSEKLLQDRLNELKKKYESDETTYIQQAKLSKEEADQLKGNVNQLELKLKQYQSQLQEMNEKYKVRFATIASCDKYRGDIIIRIRSCKKRPMK